MKIIINESQLKLIVENEGEDSLIDFTPFYNSGIPPVEWDDMFLLIKGKKAKKGDKTYDGYYITGNINLDKSKVTKLDYLVRVDGYLDLDDTQIESLAMLSYVEGYLSLNNTPIESLPMLKYVGYGLSLYDTPLSETTTRGELRSKINVEGHIYL
jgi:hypothetical protein